MDPTRSGNPAPLDALMLLRTPQEYNQMGAVMLKAKCRISTVARLENPPNLPAWIDSGGPRRASTGLRRERVIKFVGVVWCKTFARPSGSKALQPHNVTQPEIQQVR